MFRKLFRGTRSSIRGLRTRADKEQQPNILKGQETAVATKHLFFGTSIRCVFKLQKTKKTRQVPCESHIPLISPNCEGPRCLYIIFFLAKCSRKSRNQKKTPSHSNFVFNFVFSSKLSQLHAGLPWLENGLEPSIHYTTVEPPDFKRLNLKKVTGKRVANTGQAVLEEKNCHLTKGFRDQ